MKLLTERRYSFTTNAERMIVRDVKEKPCYMAFFYDTELKSTAESSDKNLTYLLSDVHIITVGAERFRFTSVLPASFIGIQASEIHDTSFQYANVVLSSGTTMFQRIVERMKKIDGVGFTHVMIMVVAPPERKH